MKNSRITALSLLLVIMMLALVTGCASPASPPTSEPPAAGTDASAPAASGSSAESQPNVSELKVALISDPIGTEQFILQAYHKVEEMAGIHGFQWTSMECSDTAQWEENGRAAANAGYIQILRPGDCQ